MSILDSVLSKPLRGGRGLFATGAVLALLRVAPADAAEQQDPLAVEEYSRRYDVDAQQAESRLEAQAKAAGIANALEARLGDDFAGVWFDNAAGQFVVPIVTAKHGAAVDRQFAEYGLGRDRYRTTLVDSTLAQLEAAQADVDGSIRRLFEEGRARSGIDPSLNAVVVEVAAHKADPAAMAGLRAQAASLRNRVRIVEADVDGFGDEAGACSWARRSCDPPFHGGVEIWIPGGVGCSSGFAATGNAQGNKFVITAGHCAKEVGTWRAATSNGFESELGLQEGYFYGGGEADAGLIRVKDSTWWVKEWGWRGHVVIWGPPSNPSAVQNPSNPISGSKSSYVGEYVCHSGAGTGASCGTVKQLNAKTSYEGGQVAMGHLTKIEGDCGDHGDSGSPVYDGNYAVGIWSGGQLGSCTVHWYTEVTEVESRYGVHVTPW